MDQQKKLGLSPGPLAPQSLPGDYDLLDVGCAFCPDAVAHYSSDPHLEGALLGVAVGSHP